MVATFGPGGVTTRYGGQGFAPVTGPALGNDVPANTGRWPPERDTPGPGSEYPGYVVGGQAGGGNDAFWGTDPRAPLMSPFPRRVAPVVEGQTSGETGPPLGYAWGATWPDALAEGYGQGGYAGNLGPLPGPEATARQSYWRGGIQGFNDKLTVRDRHAYWDTGNQKTGLSFDPTSVSPNAYNNPRTEGPLANLRTVNRSVSYQKGTDTTRNQDDLSRPYTWLGEQGSGWSPIYGGVPGLVIPYGSRGGVPFPIVDPTDGEGGRQIVWAGPPHGLHSETFPDGADILRNAQQKPQMRPVRIDRPSNSPQAGQSYSQTVQFQGSTEGAAQPGGAPDRPSPWKSGQRGWAGARRPPGRV